MNEDFGYLKDEEQSRASVIIKKCLLTGTVLFSILCFVYISINAYYFVYSDNNNEIKTIKSPEEPIKVIEGAVQTEDGVTVISDLDKNVYENIVGNKKETMEKTKSSLKMPDRPVNPPSNLSSYAIKETIANNKNGNKSAQTEKSNEKIIIYDAASKTSINDSQGKSKLAKEENNAVKTDATSDKKIETKLASSGNARNQNPPATKTKIPKQASRVQLAAMNSSKSASDYWEKLDEQHPKLFSGLKPVIQEVNLGQRGMFYRLQIDGFYSQVEAEEFCLKFINQTSKTRADCIVVE